MSLSISMCGIKSNYQVKRLNYPSQQSTKKSVFLLAIYKKCFDNANSVAVHQVSINHLMLRKSDRDALQTQTSAFLTV